MEPPLAKSRFKKSLGRKGNLESLAILLDTEEYVPTIEGISDVLSIGEAATELLYDVDIVGDFIIDEDCEKDLAIALKVPEMPVLFFMVVAPWEDPQDT